MFIYRAKLEEALERMDRVVQAVERDSVKASPYTAQLADQLGNNDATDSLSPALQQASNLLLPVSVPPATSYLTMLLMLHMAC